MDREFFLLKKADTHDSLQIWVRDGLVLGTALVLWIATDMLIFAVWGGGYVVLDQLYTRLLKATDAPVPPLRFWVGMILSGAIATWFGLMAMYIALVNLEELFAIAAVIVVGLALHALTNHGDFGWAATIDMAAVALATLAVTFARAYHAPSVAMGTAIAISGIAVLIFFIHNFRKTVSDRIALADRVDAEAQDQKMRSLGQLTSGIAHDFNNLLTVIGGNIELSRMKAQDAEQQEMLDEALNATRRGASLVSQLLAYARKSRLQAQEQHSQEVLSRLAGVTGRILPANVTLSVDEKAEDAVIRVDGAMLDTALLNLVINARDAMGGQPGEIRLTSQRESDGVLSIEVTDTGPGMDSVTLQRARDPFFTTKDQGQGSGLGLSMVNGFAEQSGGWLELDNARSGGLRAAIHLPLAESRDAAQP